MKKEVELVTGIEEEEKEEMQREDVVSIVGSFH
jgi:hypothetical protein